MYSIFFWKHFSMFRPLSTPLPPPPPTHTLHQDRWRRPTGSEYPCYPPMCLSQTSSWCTWSGGESIGTQLERLPKSLVIFLSLSCLSVDSHWHPMVLPYSKAPLGKNPGPTAHLLKEARAWMAVSAFYWKQCTPQWEDDIAQNLTLQCIVF